MTDSATTRRGFLAAGGALIAGCSGLGSQGRGAEPVSSARLPDGVESATPIVVETLPVRIRTGELRQRRDRVTGLLSRLPLPVAGTDIPNGYIREHVTEAATDATAALDDARTAPNRYQALLQLRRARARARYAAAGWETIDGSGTEKRLRRRHESAVSDASALRTGHEYVGTDPVEATVVHATIERNLHTVLENRGPSIHGVEGSVLEVAEWGEYAERAQALVGDTQYIYDRFTSRLPGDVASIDRQLAAARTTLGETLRGKRDALPAEADTSDSGQVSHLLYRLRSDAEQHTDRVSSSDRPASGILTATEGLATFAGFEELQARIDDGATIDVETASDVRQARTEALTSIRTALRDSPRPLLARTVLADPAARVAFADERLARYHGSIRPTRLDDPVREYLSATVRATGVPEACRQVTDALSP